MIESLSTIRALGNRLGLTDQQARILVMQRDGLSDEDIRAALKIAPGSLENHRSRIRARLRVRSMASAIACLDELAV